MRRDALGLGLGTVITLALAGACSRDESGEAQGAAVGDAGMNGAAGADTTSAGASSEQADAGVQPGASAAGGAGGIGGSHGGGAASGAAGEGSAGSGNLEGATLHDVVYVGSGAWTNGVGKVQVFQLDAVTAELTLEQELTYGGMVSFMATTADGKYLFATDEVGGSLAAYRIAAGTGRLTPINSVPAGGAPAYVSCDRQGHFLFASFYSEAQTRVFPILADGSLATGLLPVPSGDATHAAVIDGSNRFLFVPAKLSDWIAQYAFDETSGQLSAATPATVPAAAGSGPRHLVFHPSGQFAYVNHETDLTVSAFSLDQTLGLLSPVQAPQGAVEGSGEDWTTSEIVMHPSGKFLYVSNRLEAASSVTLFSIDEATGHVARVAEYPAQGSTPRSIALDRAGTLLLVGNQDSQNVAVFGVNPASGALSAIHTLTLDVDPVFVGVFAIPQQ